MLASYLDFRSVDELVAFRAKANELGYRSVVTAAFVAWERLQREEHVFVAFEISHYRPKKHPNSVRIVHPKNGEEAWWPLFDENGEIPFPELMAELDDIKQAIVSGLVFGATIRTGGRLFRCHGLQPSRIIGTCGQS